MDFYQLSQEDFHVLEEKISENKSLLLQKDSVSLRNLKVVKFH